MMGCLIRREAFTVVPDLQHKFFRRGAHVHFDQGRFGMLHSIFECQFRDSIPNVPDFERDTYTWFENKSQRPGFIVRPEPANQSVERAVKAGALAQSRGSGHS